ncbi:Ion channel protein, partial [Turicibacter sanguinis]|nr:Ion channel protein [Turicibacter sanguinis]
MKKMSLYQATIIVLSFVVIIMTLLQLTLSLTPQIDALFNTLDVLIWLFFFVDYLVRLGVSKDKKQFF